MSLKDYAGARDRFKARYRMGDGGLGFPCYACEHQARKHYEEPCRTCEHNLAAAPDQEESPCPPPAK
jgi:hypothetical protein